MKTNSSQLFLLILRLAFFAQNFFYKRRMKIILCIVLTSLTRIVNAQSYVVGENVVGAGVGVGSAISFFTNRPVPAFNISYERGITRLLQKGVISLGGYGEVTTMKDVFNDTAFYPTQGFYNYTATKMENRTIIGLRAAYHFTSLRTDRIDLYGGLMVSYRISSYKYSDTDTFHDDKLDRKTSSVSLSYYGGGRYYFTNNFGAFLELGFGVPFMNIGLSYKFHKQ